MYRLLVVDDEFAIRDGISHAVPWRDHGIEVVGEACDGREGLERFRARRPDIVIADIQMDNLNGLEFAAALMEEDPDVKVIIISGFDSFEYAQKALELRVTSYLLKPILPEEILAAVTRCIQAIKEERSIRTKLEAFDVTVRESRSRMSERLLEDVLEGRIDDAEDLARRMRFLSPDLPGPSYSCLLFSDDGHAEAIRAGSPKECYRRLLGMRAIVEEVLTPSYPTEIVAFTSGAIAAVVSGVFARPKSAYEALQDHLRRIQKAIKANLGATVTVAVGGVSSELLGLRRLYLEAVRCLDFRMVAGGYGIIFPSDVAAIAGSRRVYPADSETQALRGISEEDPARIASALAAFFTDVGAQRYPLQELETAVESLVSAILRQFSDKGLPLGEAKGLEGPVARVRQAGSLDELREWVRRGTLALLEELQVRRARSVRSVIQRVQEFILRNYTRPDLSLLLVAEHVSLSPSYLSKLYRKETGQSYLEAITTLRLDEARRLMLSTNNRIADIGAAVGYTNPQYFYTLFRKYTGASPAEFRERAGKRPEAP